MNASETFTISKVKVSARKTITGINCGNDFDSLKEYLERVYSEDYFYPCKVVAMRELNEDEVEIVKSGNKVEF